MPTEHVEAERRALLSLARRSEEAGCPRDWAYALRLAAGAMARVQQRQDADSEARDYRAMLDRLREEVAAAERRLAEQGRPVRPCGE